MPELRYIPFQPWHRKVIVEGTKYASPQLDPEFTAHMSRQMTGVTLLIGDEIAAILGVVVIWNGVGEVTMVPSETFYKYRKTCIKAVRELLDLAMHTFDLHRLHSMTMVSQPGHGRFLQTLGFVRETVDTGIIGYGPNGENIHVWGKTS